MNKKYNYKFFTFFFSHLTSFILFLLFAFSLFTSTSVFAQGWNWTSGSKVVDQAGYYGKIYPEALFSSVTWIDDSGNFWFYGGIQSGNDDSYPISSGHGFGNLWKYDVSTNIWHLIKQSTVYNQPPIWGAKGISDPENTPGARMNSASWKDLEGNLWLFGGLSKYGALNDLWKFDIITNEWTWVSGSNLYDQKPQFGTKGVPSVDNISGARYNATSWVDLDGNFWLFGGSSYHIDFISLYVMNDLWKYDPFTNEWTWINGFNSINDLNDGTVLPSRKNRAAGWVDNNGDLWLFGGSTRNNNSPTNNGLHKYTISSNTWTYLKGGSSYSGNLRFGIYGTKGVPSSTNIPGPRANSYTWKDNLGNLWLFGGYSSGKNKFYNGFFNDLWKYDISTNQFTWISGADTASQRGIYGTIGVPSVNNIPGGRQNGLSWIDNNGKFWLLGGIGYMAQNLNEGSLANLNDLWNYNLSTDEWTWVNGTNTRNHNGVLDYRGTSSPKHIPGARFYSTTISRLNPNFTYLFGGEGVDEDGNIGYLNDYWRYNNNQWTFISGSRKINQNGIYGTLGVFDAENTPGSRYGAEIIPYSGGATYLFGGYGYDEKGNVGYLNDFWRDQGGGYNHNWEWFNGSNTVDQYGNYGTKGVETTTNMPGGRKNISSWQNVANSGISSAIIWIFGGEGLASNGDHGWLNDLWQHNFNNDKWTWISGTDSINKPGIYDTLGVPSKIGYPGGRHGATTWTDKDGNLWLFGGQGVDAYSTSIDLFGTLLNDLWKYDVVTNEWTWVSGNPLGSEQGYYGTKWLADSRNTPGGRYDAVGWIDEEDNLWLFGGYGLDENDNNGLLNDVWKYDTKENLWAWVYGDKIENQYSNFGIMGVTDSLNTPGGRWGSVSWIDSNNTFWMFGGQGYTETGDQGIFNDLWKFEIPPVKIVSVEDKAIIPQEYTLSQNYPNPFNPTTTISYSIPVVDAKFASTTNVILKIYDILGTEVKTLVNKKQNPGNYKIEFDASSLSSGIYFYSLSAGNYLKTKKMMLLK